MTAPIRSSLCDLQPDVGEIKAKCYWIENSKITSIMKRFFFWNICNEKDQQSLVIAYLWFP